MSIKTPTPHVKLLHYYHPCTVIHIIYYTCTHVHTQMAHKHTPMNNTRTHAWATYTPTPVTPVYVLAPTSIVTVVQFQIVHTPGSIWESILGFIAEGTRSPCTHRCIHIHTNSPQTHAHLSQTCRVNRLINTLVSCDTPWSMYHGDTNERQGSKLHLVKKEGERSNSS